MADDDPRKELMLRSVDEAVQASRLTTMQRMGEGKPPLDVVVCLGPGRCLIPGAETTPHTCPFCTTVSMRAGAVVEVSDVVNRVFSGN